MRVHECAVVVVGRARGFLVFRACPWAVPDRSTQRDGARSPPPPPPPHDPPARRAEAPRSGRTGCPRCCGSYAGTRRLDAIKFAEHLCTGGFGTRNLDEARELLEELGLEGASTCPYRWSEQRTDHRRSSRRSPDSCAGRDGRDPAGWTAIGAVLSVLHPGSRTKVLSMT
jgi:hypothetical protein